MTTTPDIRRWPIPHSRLPFTNQDVTPIQFRGSPGLVSSVWGGHQGGRIYVWNPDTHEAAEFYLPDKVPGAYMLQTAADGRLYLGGGCGELLRYDPSTEKIETLVNDQMNHITWGGCVTDRYAIWTAKPGDVCVYDWREDKLAHVFREIDSETPPALHGHNVVVAPDGRVIIGMNMPQARLVVLDLETMTPESFTPEALRGANANYGSIFLDNQTMYVTIGHHDCRSALLRYPGFETIAEFDPPPGVDWLGRRGCLLHDTLYAFGNTTGGLYALDQHSLTWNMVCKDFDGGEGDSVSAITAYDDRLICSVTRSGMAVSFDPKTKAYDAFELPAFGHCEVRALCPVPEIGKVFGAPFISPRFWSLDIDTGENADLGRGMRGGGQIDFAIWDPKAQLVYFSSYHESNISVYDPAKPAQWPNNPRFLATAFDHDQMRDKALAFDGIHLWMATCAQYGKLGGALSRIDPATGNIDVRRHIVPDQTLTSVILGHDSVYCGTSIFADGRSTPATKTHAELIRVEPTSMTVTARTTVGDNEALFALGIVGEQLFAQSLDRYYMWHPDTDQLTDLGEASALFTTGIIPDSSGKFWASDGQTFGKITVTKNSAHYEPIMNEGGRYISRTTDGSIWLSTKDEIVCAVAAKQLSRK